MHFFVYSRFIAVFLILMSLFSCNENKEIKLMDSENHIRSVVESNNIIFFSPPDKQHTSIYGKGALGMMIGNGRMGGLLFTGYDSLKIQLNHTDFWRYNPSTRMHPGYGARPFGLAKIFMAWDGFDSTNTNYKQTLNLYEAIAKTELKSGNKSLKIEPVFGLNQDLLSFKITSNNIHRIKLGLKAWRESSQMILENNMAILYDKPDLSRSPDEIDYLEKLSAGNYDSLYSTQATAILINRKDGSEFKLDGQEATAEIVLKDNDIVYITIGSIVEESSEKLPDPVKKVKNLLSEFNQTEYSNLKEAQLKWWSDYWQSSYIQIESKDSLTVMLENIWYLFKYYMAVTYKGKYPAKFNYSNWIINGDERLWGGGYWQFNQSPEHVTMFAMNHPEFANNYFNPLFDNLELIKKQTLDIWGHEGAFVHETHTPDGLSYLRNRQWNYDGDSLWTSLVFSSGLEIAYQMYQQALFMGDEEYLQNKVFPFMRETALFYVYHLKKDQKGQYYLYPANAHENFWAVKNPQTDLAAIRRCFPILTGLYDKFDASNPEKEIFTEVLHNLSPFFRAKVIRDFSKPLETSIVGIDTTKDVFAPCIFMNDTLVHNRHSVDTYTTWPFELTTILHPDYSTAVNTLNNRFFPKVEYELMKEMLPVAILQLPETARDLADQYFKAMPFPENAAAYPETLALLSQTINYMFLQSYDSLIQVFPSIPSNWNASYKLRAQGPSIIYATYDSGSVSFLRIKCLKDQKLTLKNPFNSEAYILDEENNLLKKSTENIIEWDGDKDEIYFVTKDLNKNPEFQTLSKRTANNKVFHYGGQSIGIK